MYEYVYVGSYTFKKQINIVHYKLVTLSSIYQRCPCVMTRLDNGNKSKLNSNGKKTSLQPYIIN